MQITLSVELPSASQLQKSSWLLEAVSDRFNCFKITVNIIIIIIIIIIINAVGLKWYYVVTLISTWGHITIGNGFKI